MPRVCCYVLWPVPETQSPGSVSWFTQHTWREECAAHVAGPPDLQMSQCPRAACKERGCEAETSHGAVQGPEWALGSLTGSFATAGSLHGSRFLLEVERTIPALLSVRLRGLPLDLGSVAPSPAPVRVFSVSAEHSSTRGITIQRQCSSVSRTAQRIVKNPTIL